MPEILVTVDVEVGEMAFDRDDGFDTFIEGKVDGKKVGYSFIMDLLDEYGVKGEFFVDIYRYKTFKDTMFCTLCEEIKKRGHFVQLHTHPSGAFDRNRKYMHQYSLNEQIEIIEMGKEKIKEYIGSFPKAHRAGGYGINKDTVKALEKADIYYDSSYFYGNSTCKFKTHVVNRPFKKSDILEIPVTVYKKDVRYSLHNINFFKRTTYQKLDIKNGSNGEEIKSVLLKMSRFDTAILFLHSSNFLSMPYDFKKRKFGKISIDNGLIGEFERLLEDILLLKDCTFSNINNLSAVNFAEYGDYVPQITKRQSIIKKIGQKIAKA